jgi:hypothetical protein
MSFDRQSRQPTGTRAVDDGAVGTPGKLTRVQPAAGGSPDHAESTAGIADAVHAGPGAPRRDDGDDFLTGLVGAAVIDGAVGLDARGSDPDLLQALDEDLEASRDADREDEHAEEEDEAAELDEREPLEAGADRELGDPAAAGSELHLGDDLDGALGADGGGAMGDGAIGDEGLAGAAWLARESGHDPAAELEEGGEGAEPGPGPAAPGGAPPRVRGGQQGRGQQRVASSHRAGASAGDDQSEIASDATAGGQPPSPRGGRKRGSARGPADPSAAADRWQDGAPASDAPDVQATDGAAEAIPGRDLGAPGAERPAGRGRSGRSESPRRTGASGAARGRGRSEPASADATPDPEAPPASDRASRGSRGARKGSARPDAGALTPAVKAGEPERATAASPEAADRRRWAPELGILGVGARPLVAPEGVPVPSADRAPLSGADLGASDDARTAGGEREGSADAIAQPGDALSALTGLPGLPPAAVEAGLPPGAAELMTTAQAGPPGTAPLGPDLVASVAAIAALPLPPGAAELVAAVAPQPLPGTAAPADAAPAPAPTPGGADPTPMSAAAPVAAPEAARTEGGRAEGGRAEGGRGEGGRGDGGAEASTARGEGAGRDRGGAGGRGGEHGEVAPVGGSDRGPQAGGRAAARGLDGDRDGGSDGGAPPATVRAAEAAGVPATAVTAPAAARGPGRPGAGPGLADEAAAAVAGGPGAGGKTELKGAPQVQRGAMPKTPTGAPAAAPAATTAVMPQVASTPAPAAKPAAGEPLTQPSFNIQIPVNSAAVPEVPQTPAPPPMNLQAGAPAPVTKPATKAPAAKPAAPTAPAATPRATTPPAVAKAPPPSTAARAQVAQLRVGSPEGTAAPSTPAAQPAISSTSGRATGSPQVPAIPTANAAPLPARAPAAPLPEPPAASGTATAAPRVPTPDAPLPTVPPVQAPSGTQSVSPASMVQSSASLGSTRQAAATSLQGEVRTGDSVKPEGDRLTQAQLGPLPAEMARQAPTIEVPGRQAAVASSVTGASSALQRGTSGTASTVATGQAQIETQMQGAERARAAAAAEPPPRVIAQRAPATTAPVAQASAAIVERASNQPPMAPVATGAGATMAAAASAALAAKTTMAPVDPGRAAAIDAPRPLPQVDLSAQATATTAAATGFSQARQALGPLQNVPPPQIQVPPPTPVPTTPAAPAPQGRGGGGGLRGGASGGGGGGGGGGAPAVPHPQEAINTIQQGVGAAYQQQSPGVMKGAAAQIAPQYEGEIARAEQQNQQAVTAAGAQAQQRAQEVQQTPRPPEASGAAAQAAAQAARATGEATAKQAKTEADGKAAAARGQAASQQVAAQGTATAQKGAARAAQTASNAGSQQAYTASHGAASAAFSGAQVAAAGVKAAADAAAQATAQQRTATEQQSTQAKVTAKNQDHTQQTTKAQQDHQRDVQQEQQKSTQEQQKIQQDTEQKKAKRDADMRRDVQTKEAEGNRQVQEHTQRGEQQYTQRIEQGQRDADSHLAQEQAKANAKEAEARAQEGSGNIIGDAINWVRARVNDLLNAAKAILAAARDFAVSIMNKARDAALGMLEAARNAALQALNAVKQAIQGLIRAAADAIRQIISAAAALIRAAIQALATALQTLVRALTTLLTTLVNALRTAINAILDALVAVVSLINADLGRQLQQATQGFRDAVNRAADTLNQAIETAGRTLEQNIQRAADTAIAAVDAAEQALHNAVTQIETALNNAVEAAFQAAAAVVNAAFDAAEAAVNAAFDVAIAAVEAYFNAQIAALDLVQKGVNAYFDLLVAAADFVLESISKIAAAVVDLMPDWMVKGFVDFWNGPWRSALIIGLATIAAVAITVATVGTGAPLAAMLVAGVIGGTLAGGTYLAGEAVARQGTIDLSTSGEGLYIPNYGHVPIGPDGKPDLSGVPEDQRQAVEQSAQWSMSNFQGGENGLAMEMGPDGKMVPVAKSHREIGNYAMKEGVKGFGEGFVSSAMAAGGAAFGGIAANASWIAKINNPITQRVVGSLVSATVEGGFDIMSGGMSAAWTTGFDALASGKSPQEAFGAAMTEGWKAVRDPGAWGAALMNIGVSGARARGVDQWMDNALRNPAVREAADTAIDTGAETVGEASANFGATYAEEIAKGTPPGEALSRARAKANESFDPTKIMFSASMNVAGNRVNAATENIFSGAVAPRTDAPATRPDAPDATPAPVTVRAPDPDAGDPAPAPATARPQPTTTTTTRADTEVVDVPATRPRPTSTPTRTEAPTRVDAVDTTIADSRPSPRPDTTADPAAPTRSDAVDADPRAPRNTDTTADSVAAVTDPAIVTTRPDVDPIAQPVAGASGAVPDSRYSGDSAGRRNAHNVQAGVVEAMPKLSRHFDEGRVTATADGLRIDAGGTTRDVRVEVVPTSQLTTSTDVANFDLSTSPAVIRVSERASKADVERALAHEVAEMMSVLDTQAGTTQRSATDSLASDSTPTTLSHHDVGRVAELRVLMSDLEGGSRRTKAETEAEVDALIRHLGITGSDPQSVRRREMVEAELGRSLNAEVVRADQARRDQVQSDLDSRIQNGDASYTEVHNHFLGVVDVDIFGQRFGGQVELLNTINESFQSGDLRPHGHDTDEAGNITRRGTSGDAQRIVEAAVRDIAELQTRLDQTTDPAERRQLEQDIQATAERANQQVLRASSETDFNSSYEIRDALIKREAGDPPPRDASAEEKRAYDQRVNEAYYNLAVDSVKALARDGIGYSEQSMSLNKLDKRFPPGVLDRAINDLRSRGELPRDIEIQWLAMTNTANFGTRDVLPEQDLPQDWNAMDRAAQEAWLADYHQRGEQGRQNGWIRDYTSLFGTDAARARFGDEALAGAWTRDGKTSIPETPGAVSRPDVVGMDVAGAETFRFDAGGRERFASAYEALAAAAQQPGAQKPLVFRPHVGEGAVDPQTGKPWNRDTDRVRSDEGELLYIDRARENLDAMLDVLSDLQRNGKLDPDAVVVRFGHATHVTPEQAARMRDLGVIAETNLGSNVATGSLDQTGGVDQRLPPGTPPNYDQHGLATQIFYDVDTILSTDAHAVMSTSMPQEFATAHRIIEDVLAGRRPVRVSEADANGRGTPRGDGTVDLMVTDLTPAELAKFQNGYQRLHDSAQAYRDRIRGTGGDDAAPPAAPISPTPRPDDGGGGALTTDVQDTSRAQREQTRDTLDGAVARGDASYTEVHNHFLGVADVDMFAGWFGSGDGANQQSELLATIHRSFESGELKPFRHQTDGDGNITTRGVSGDAQRIVEDAMRRVTELEQQLAVTTDPGRRRQIEEEIQQTARAANERVLRASDETDFNSSYEIRDALIKERAAQQLPADANKAARVQAENDAYYELALEAVRVLARDGIGYSEQSMSLNKLGKRYPEGVLERAVNDLRDRGELPRDIEIQWLAMANTENFGTRDVLLEEKLPADWQSMDRTQQEAWLAEKHRGDEAGRQDGWIRDYTSLFGTDAAMAKFGEAAMQRAHARDGIPQLPGAMVRKDVVGMDVAGAETFRFNEAGRERFAQAYEALAAQAKAQGRPLVFRPHVGEGAVDPKTGKPWNRDTDRVRTDESDATSELLYIDRARENLDSMIEVLEGLDAEGKLDRDNVIVRFGHATHVTPEQAARMQRLGVIAETNLGSNVATGSLDQTGGVDQRLPPGTLPNYDQHGLATQIFYDVDTILSTDAHSVMSTTMGQEYATAYRIIDDVLAGRRPVRVTAADAQGRGTPRGDGTVDLMVTDLTPAERAKFERGYERLYAAAEQYRERIHTQGTDTQGAVTQGSASAVKNSSFRGDALSAPDATAVQAGVTSALPSLGAHFPDGRVRQRGNQLELDAGGTTHLVDIVVVPKDQLGSPSDVANYDLSTTPPTIKVSDQADPADVQRALAHEAAEIMSVLDEASGGAQRSTKDALHGNSAELTLSHHDLGRIAEIRVLTADLADPAKRARAEAELKALLIQLGVMNDKGVKLENDGGALQRRALIEQELGRGLDTLGLPLKSPPAAIHEGNDELPLRGQQPDEVQPRRDVTREEVDAVIPEELVQALERFGLSRQVVVDYVVDNHNNRSRQRYLPDLVGLARQYAPMGLTDADAWVIDLYTTKLFYRQLNRRLYRDIEPDSVKELQTLLTSALEKLPPWDAETIYRSRELKGKDLVDFMAEHAVGTEVTWKAFSSVAGGIDGTFWRFEEATVLFEIKNAKAYDISDFADGIHYRDPPMGAPELLMPAGAKLLVKEVIPEDRGDGQPRFRIIVEQVHPTSGTPTTTDPTGGGGTTTPTTPTTVTPTPATATTTTPVNPAALTTPTTVPPTSRGGEATRLDQLEPLGGDQFAAPRHDLRELVQSLGEVQSTTVDPTTTAVTYEVKLPDGRVVRVTEKVDPAADWVAALKTRLDAEGVARLDAELGTGLTPQQLMDQYGGSFDAAVDRLATKGGASVPPVKDSIDMYAVGEIPTDPDARWNWKNDPNHWTPERRRLHTDLIAKAKAQAQQFADAVQSGSPTIFAMRGNTAAGKTRAVSSSVPELAGPMKQTKDLPHRSVNPDNFKMDLIAASGGSLTSAQVHWESSMLAERLEQELLGMKTSDGTEQASMLIDKRLASAGEVQHYAQMAKDSGREFVLYDVDAPLEASLAGVLERIPGGADPLPPFDIVASGFSSVRSNRTKVLDMFLADPKLGTYEMYGTRATGERVPAAVVRNGVLEVKDPELFQQLMAGPEDTAQVLAATRITEEQITEITANLDASRAEKVGNLLRKYLGFTWKAALDAHAAEKPLLQPDSPPAAGDSAS